MKTFILFLLLGFSIFAEAQCYDIKGQYAIAVNETTVRKEVWKVQVMRLSQHDAREVKFHKGTRLHFDVCSNTWTVSVEEDFISSVEAMKERNTWRQAGYKDAFIYLEYRYESKTPVIPKAEKTSITDTLRRKDTLRIDYTSKEFKGY